MATFTNQATLSYNNITTSSNVITGELLETLAVTKRALDNSYAPGDTVTYIISIVNSSTDAFTGLSITDDLGGYSFGTPAGTLYPLDYVPGTMTYYVNGVLQATPTVTSTAPVTISNLNIPADSNSQLIYQARANGFAPLGTGGTINNTATVTGGGLSAPITAADTLTVAQDPRLAISKSLSPSSVAENGQITYTFLIENFGPVAADAADNASVSDIFNPILENITVSFNGTSWAPTTNYTYDETTGTFTTVPGQITVPAATYTQDPVTGVVGITPGTSTLVVSGTV